MPVPLGGGRRVAGPQRASCAGPGLAGQGAKPAVPLKWHGGKSELAKVIVGLMPPHLHYVEPYAGGLAVLLAKDPVGVSEVVNDIHRDLTNFWKVIRDEAPFARFRRAVSAVPFSEPEWRDARDRLGADPDADPVDRAVWFFVACRQSLAGRMKSFTSLTKRRVRRGMNGDASAWASAVDGLPAVHARLRRVVILDRPALEVIRQQDGPGTCFYLDPPYLASTRTAPNVYAHEMDERDHRGLLALVPTLKGKVLLSGLASDLYDRTLAGWTRHTFDVPNNAASGTRKRRMTEVVWCNF